MRKMFFLLLLFLMPFTVTGHDFFLYPNAFHVQPGDSVTISIHVAQTFPGKAVKWETQRVLLFRHFANNFNNDLRDLAPLPDSSGVKIRLRHQGVHGFALNWAAKYIEIDAEHFNEYLASEGLDHILELRKKRGESDRPGRERYSRYVKTFICAGKPDDRAYKRTIGQMLELVPLNNPYRLSVGDTLTVQLLFRGKPLAGALISSTYADFQGRPDHYLQSARTNEKGIARVPISHTGPWLVRCVYMLPRDADPKATLESWWGSITFEVK